MRAIALTLHLLAIMLFEQEGLSLGSVKTTHFCFIGQTIETKALKEILFCDSNFHLEFCVDVKRPIHQNQRYIQVDTLICHCLQGDRLWTIEMQVAKSKRNCKL